MRFHAILFVRDEEDVIEQSLVHNAQWCDHIYVYDTGSTDNTWDIVVNCANNLSQIRPIRREPVWFNDALRAMAFQECRHYAEPGDWWVRLDADEFYHVSPRQFVMDLDPVESVIYHAYYNFGLTDREASTLDYQSVLAEDRKRPIHERRRFYTLGFDYSEPRLFRYRSSMRWSPTAFGPFNAGYVARRRIPIRHYQNRDPLQMRRRYHLRLTMMQEMRRMYGPHTWEVEDWRKQLLSASDPTVLCWDLQQDSLPPCERDNHLEAPLKRALQRVVHSTCVSVLDRTRPSFPPDFRPTPLPSALQEELKQLCD